MAAATTSATQATADIVTAKVEGAIRNLLDENTMKGFGTSFNWADTFTIATTYIDDVGDIRRLLKFPAGAVIDDFRGTITDVDTNATPTMVYSVVIVDSADVVKATLVTSSTKGQAGGTDRIADGAVGAFVGDYYLAIKVGTAAATAAAGTYKVYLRFSIGTLSLQSDMDPLMTAHGA